MATPTDLAVLLRLYTGKQDSPSFNLQDFCDYLQKYARHYAPEAPELVIYMTNTLAVVQKELDKLAENSRITLSTDIKGRKIVFVPQFYIDKVTQRYREIEDRIEIPFPLSSELPQNYPPAIVKQLYITSDFAEQIESTERNNTILYQLVFPDETTPLIYPGAISPERLLDLSLAKIRLFLRKDESRDYIQKRLMMANPGKELTIKNHLIQFQTRPTESLNSLKHSGEAFIFWSYLCSFIRQDYTKKNEKTPEETSLLQAVFIIEYLNNYYKNKAQQNLQRETALKNLELAFQKPPYFFDMETITRFTDSRGVPLLGQYKNTDLEDFIKNKTGDADPNSLPVLLVFKTTTNNRYFVLKEKIFPLMVKLCNDSRKIIRDQLIKEWYKVLKNYDQEPSMKSHPEFEKRIEELCATHTPILQSLLSASFIPLLAMDGDANNSANGFKVFDHGRLLPLSELLMVNRHELLSATRILLPFWYTMPVIASILAFFNRPKASKTAPRDTPKEPVTIKESEIPGQTQDLQKKRKADIKRAIASVEKYLVPAGSTLEFELNSQLELWNRTLDPNSKENLTEDVNVLIRDYIRRILKTIKASTLSHERIENLSNTLVDTPNLMKIKNRDALLRYVQLYITYLFKNIG